MRVNETSHESNCCSGGTCGCRLDVYPTFKDCPDCGKRLRIIGRAQTFELRLNCQHCGYSGSLLSGEEISELL